MTQSLQQQATALLYQALETPVGARAAFLAEACGANAELHAMVSDLLAPIEQLDAFLDNPLALPDAPATEVAPAAAVPGSMLGSWRVVRELQRGALGSIMLVERSSGGARQIAALKIVNVDELSLEALARFQRERDKLATLTHPDLARLIDAGSSADGRPFFVMEYSDGLRLDLYCAEWKLAAQQRIALVIRVCMALHHGHQRLVIHGDLEPSNVLVDRSGVLKVIDFGVASLLDVRTATDSPFASPESRAGRAHGTPADIYALGALLDAVLRAGADAPHGAVADIIRTATAADAEHRYGSAHELARVLQGYLNAQTPGALPEPVAAAAPATTAPAAAASTQSVPPVAAATAAVPTVAAPIAAGTLTTMAAAVSNAHAPVKPVLPVAPQAAPKRSKRLMWTLVAMAIAAPFVGAALHYLPGGFRAPGKAPAAPVAAAGAATTVPAPPPSQAAAAPVVAQASDAPAAPLQAGEAAQPGEAALQRGDYAEAVTQLRKALEGSDTPQLRFALGRALAAAQDYAGAEAEFMLARSAFSGQSNSAETLEVDLARAETFHQRQHGRKAGQTVMDIKPLLADASEATRARVALLEALIQPRGTAAKAYASAQKALPQLLAESERDPADAKLQRWSAQAWHKAGQIGLRAGQKDSACGYLELAGKRYGAMEADKRATALDTAAREQVEVLQKSCR